MCFALWGHTHRNLETLSSLHAEVLSMSSSTQVTVDLRDNNLCILKLIWSEHLGGAIISKFPWGSHFKGLTKLSLSLSFHAKSREHKHCTNPVEHLSAAWWCSLQGPLKSCSSSFKLKLKLKLCVNSMRKCCSVFWLWGLKWRQWFLHPGYKFKCFY